MRITVKGVKHNIGYALWQPHRLDNETDQEYLDRVRGMDDALRECDEKRAKQLGV